MEKTVSAKGLFLGIILAALSSPQSVLSWPIPDTGQTKCYNNAGEITCPQPSEAPGEMIRKSEGRRIVSPEWDGNFNINPPSYTKLDAQGHALPDNAAAWAMVRDNVTGLIWENKMNDGSIHDGNKTFTWCDTNPATNGGNQGTCGSGTGAAATDTQAFVKALNDARFGGFADRHLPGIQELMTLTDRDWFPNTVNYGYLSSSTYVEKPEYVWYASFGSSLTDDNIKSSPRYVRAVRGVKLRLPGDLVINGDGTVTDRAAAATRCGIKWNYSI